MIMKGSLLPFLKDLSLLNLGREKLFRIILMLTARCPLRCRVCGIGGNGSMQEPTFIELERFFSRNSFTWINLTGGEIFLRDDMAEIFRLIASNQTHLAFITFPTSGFLVSKTQKDVEAALRAGLPRIVVTVSFDGGPAAHDALRGVKDSFLRARETYDGLQSLAAGSRGRLRVLPGLTLSAELLSLTKDPLEELIQALGLQGPDEIHVNLAHRSKHYYDNEGMNALPVSEAVELIESLVKARGLKGKGLGIMERLYLKGARRYLVSGNPPISCKALKASVFIDAEWNVYPCTIYSRPLAHMGDLDFDLKTLCTLPAFRDAAKAVASGRCPGCWTPCEAYTAISGGVLKPSLMRLAFF